MMVMVAMMTMVVVMVMVAMMVMVCVCDHSHRQPLTPTCMRRPLASVCVRVARRPDGVRWHRRAGQRRRYRLVYRAVEPA